MLTKGKYILEGTQVVPETDLFKWAEWMETHNLNVRYTLYPGGMVSTIFLGLDHNWGMGEPALFETMIFKNGEADWMTQCSTYEQALINHQVATDKVLNTVQWNEIGI